MPTPNLPYGIDDLDPKVNVQAGPPKRIRCFVKECQHFLEAPTKTPLSGEVCPDHGIRCHSSPTYVYADPSRNVIVDPEMFGHRIVGHPDKADSRQLGNENSEDTLSWNVFRYFQNVGCLSRLVAESFRLPDVEEEPQLYLWGLRIDDELKKWDLLTQARDEFDSRPPAARQETEPDIALHVPGKYLLLIEAKFTSSNVCYTDEHSRPLQELRDKYSDDSLKILDFDKARNQGRLYYQLWRNMVFAEWMAKQDSDPTEAYVINLVREDHDEESALEFRELLKDDYRDRFRQVTWEEIYRWAACHGDRDELLCRYMEKKTAKLKKAFKTV